VHPSIKLSSKALQITFPTYISELPGVLEEAQIKE